MNIKKLNSYPKESSSSDGKYIVELGSTYRCGSQHCNLSAYQVKGIDVIVDGDKIDALESLSDHDKHLVKKVEDFFMALLGMFKFTPEAASRLFPDCQDAYDVIKTFSRQDIEDKLESQPDQDSEDSEISCGSVVRAADGTEFVVTAAIHKYYDDTIKYFGITKYGARQMYPQEELTKLGDADIASYVPQGTDLI